MAEKQNVLLIHENSRLSKMSTSKVSSFYIFYWFFKRLIDWGVFYIINSIFKYVHCMCENINIKYVVSSNSLMARGVWYDIMSFSPVSSTNKPAGHDMAEILFNVALYTTTLTLNIYNTEQDTMI